MMKPKNGLSTLYVATNQVNGNQYIGITAGYLSQRKSKHFSNAKRNSQVVFHRAIRKYGRDQFLFVVHSTYQTFEEAKEAEIKLIAELKPEYNMTIGGDGLLGYKMSKASLAKALATKLANGTIVRYWKGKKLPPHIGELTRQRNRASPHKDRILALGPKARARKVVCLNDGKEFESGEEAARHYNIDSASINSVCRRSKIRKTAGGLVFRYYGDHLGGVEEAHSVRESAKIAGRKLLKPTRCTPVIRLDDGAVFNSVKEAAHANGTTSAVIINGCKHRHKYERVAKAEFRYLSEYRASID